jgi:hypothetical protein
MPSFKNRVKRLLQRQKKQKGTTPPPRPETYPSLPLKLVLTPSIKAAGVAYLRKKLNALYAKTGALTGKQTFINAQGKASTKTVPINSFAREFGQKSLASMNTETKYVEWQLKQWEKAPLSNTPQLLPHIPEKVFTRLPQQNIVTTQHASSSSVGPFKDSMTLNDIKKLYKKLLLQHHPNKGGSANTFIKIRNQYRYVITKRSIDELYTEGTLLLTASPSTGAQTTELLNTISTVVLTGKLLSAQEQIPAGQFETLRLKQIGFAKAYKVPVKAQQQRLRTILKDIEALKSAAAGSRWTVKSLIRDLAGVKGNSKIQSLVRKADLLDKIIRSVRKLQPTFIFKHNGKELLIDQTYIDALVADLMAMKLTTYAALEDARKALKRKTNKNLQAFYKRSQLAQDEMMQWFTRNTASSSTGQYKKLLISAAPLQYMLHMLPTASGHPEMIAPPPPTTGSSILNQVYAGAVGMTSFIALGLLHRIQRRIQQ